MRIGFVHTVPALAESFERGLAAVAPGATAMHRVDPSLLARARERGVDDVVHERVDALVAELIAEGADAVLVTCSSIGESAERSADRAAVPVVRVDGAMADEAIALAGASGRRPGRIAVLATLTATLGPTTRLLERAGAGQDPPQLRSRLLEDALLARETGDQERHDALIAEAVTEEAGWADVVVVAQASMAAAAAHAQVVVPVLTSPTSALLRTVAATGGVRRAGREANDAT